MHHYLSTIFEIQYGEMNISTDRLNISGLCIKDTIHTHILLPHNLAKAKKNLKKTLNMVRLFYISNLIGLFDDFCPTFHWWDNSDIRVTSGESVMTELAYTEYSNQILSQI